MYECILLLCFFPLLCMRLLFVVNRLTVFLSFCYIYKDFVRQLKVFPPSFCLFCACEMSPGWGHLITWMDPSVGHLNGIFARVGGIWTIIFKKVKCPGVCPGGACWTFDLTDTLQEHQAMSFVTKLNSWRRKHYKIRLDSFLYLSGFTAKINTTVCSSRLFSTDLERHLSTS